MRFSSHYADRRHGTIERVFQACAEEIGRARGAFTTQETVQDIEALRKAKDAPAGTANIEEYLTMVSAGLVGSTPHMISASVTALSRSTCRSWAAPDFHRSPTRSRRGVSPGPSTAATSRTPPLYL